MSDTLGPEGIVPFVLVFGEYPPTFTTSENKARRTAAHTRAKIANDARIVMTKHMGISWVTRALKHAVLLCTEFPPSPGEQVLVWRGNGEDHLLWTST